MADNTNEYPTLDESLIITKPGTVQGNARFLAGGLGNVKGLRVSGHYAGFRRNPTRNDFMLAVTDQPVVASAMFTQNRFAAAPVRVSRTNIEKSKVADALDVEKDEGVCAVLINSGQANAATGEPGFILATYSTEVVAGVVGCKPHQVLVASTGVIGKLPYEELFQAGVENAYKLLGSADGTDYQAGQAAAEAIMTTDTFAKQAAVEVSLDTGLSASGGDGVLTCHIGGIIKGSGMIQPNMATMLSLVATDAQLSQAAADQAFKTAINASLNKVTVDSDTSTNDTAFFLATGASNTGLIEVGTAAFDAFVEGLTALCVELTRQLAADGEGATKLITVKISGAIDDSQADLAARSVANSPLVKTAVAGHDANWGRIVMALGKSGAEFDQSQVNITFLGLPVMQSGLPVPFSEEEALRLFDELVEVFIEADLGTGGSGSAVIWSCDLTHGYIAINGDYRS
ncbi:MAG: bifunctional glutamate N-acetyltransferase/amino-acid acetyltransferase ArgJ [Coriobacteriia bacterium]|nr:bifunctional glutamate N-acetyltransferase/amino-acid acetyltransferase ArgJ [Coriobacteriia bacterium]